MSYSRSLESNRLEIVLIAAGVLVLVSILGILILLGIGLEPPPPHQDAKNCQRSTAWGGTWIEQETQLVDPYHDEEETFIDYVRRKSKSMADEFKHELNSLTRGFTVSSGSPAVRLPKDLGIAGKLRKFSLDNALFSPRRQSDPEMGCEGGCEVLESPVSVTGREDELKGHLRKSSRPARNPPDCNLEGQHVDDSIV
ncbi:Fc.00g110850.m01.CDS01 [Cosmosporella sp. VM-42]